MSSQTTTTGANFLTTVYQDEWSNAVYTNPFLRMLTNWLGEPREKRGNTNKYQWLLRSAGNSSVEVFDETTSYPTEGYQASVKAEISPTYIRSAVNIQDIMLDAMGGAGEVDITDFEISGSMDDIADLYGTSFLGSTYGLELAVDYGSAYAGITRNGSAAYFEATETAVGGSLAMSNLEDLLEVTKDNDKGGNPNLWVCPGNQLTNILRLAPTNQTQYTVNDKMGQWVMPTLAGRPIIEVGDLTDTVIFLLTMNKKCFDLMYWRRMRIDPMAKTNDSKRFQVSSGIAFPCKMPKYQGKLTGVTA